MIEVPPHDASWTGWMKRQHAFVDATGPERKKNAHNGAFFKQSMSKSRFRVCDKETAFDNFEHSSFFVIFELSRSAVNHAFLSWTEFSISRTLYASSFIGRHVAVIWRLSFQSCVLHQLRFHYDGV